MTAKEKLDSTVREIEDAAYKRGIQEGWSQVQSLAVVVPSSVTKKDLFRQLEIIAADLKIKMEG